MIDIGGGMNWPRITLDGISMSLLFNAVVGVGFMLWSQRADRRDPIFQRFRAANQSDHVSFPAFSSEFQTNVH